MQERLLVSVKENQNEDDNQDLEPTSYIPLRLHTNDNPLLLRQQQLEPTQLMH